MSVLPRDRSPDCTLAFAREGYRFISRRCERYGSDIFEARLLLRRTICLRGRDAAELFYDEERFERRWGAPARMQKTLTGLGGVQGLDGMAHRNRKRMLMSLVGPDRIRGLVDDFARDWRAQLPRWESAERVHLYDEVGRMLCRAACAWAGIPLAEPEIRRRTDDMHAMIEGTLLVGPAFWRSRRSRTRCEALFRRLVERVRRGAQHVPDGAPLRVIAEHRDERGRPLDARVAAVELLNLVRPIVAIDRFVAFAALALHRYPEWRDRLGRDGEPIEPFVHEVRRYYPFFAATAARVRRSFDWRGCHFSRGQRVLLDLYGTNRHPRLWAQPEQFRPERFDDWDGDPFSLVPQGGGEHYPGHRCAGEWTTIEIMKTAVGVLTRSMSYDVPEQDLSVSLRRIPTLPASGFVLTNVRAAPRFSSAGGG